MLALDTFAVELAHWFNLTWRLGQNAIEIRSVTLTSWSEAGSQIVDTEPSFNFSFFANPALYCLSLKKQSVLKWSAQTYTTLGRFRGTWPSNWKLNHSVLCGSIAGRQCRARCWVLHPETEQGCSCRDIAFDTADRTQTKCQTWHNTESWG